MEYTSIRDQYCPNTTCCMHGQKLKGNILVHSRQHRRLKCRMCQKTWVEHRESMIYRLRTDQTTLKWAFALLGHGTSIRKTANQIGVSPSTIQRWKKRNGKADLPTYDHEVPKYSE